MSCIQERWYNKLFGCTKHKKICLISSSVPCGLHYLHSVAVETATAKSLSFQINFIRTKKISYMEAFLLDVFGNNFFYYYDIKKFFILKKLIYLYKLQTKKHIICFYLERLKLLFVFLK